MVDCRTSYVTCHDLPQMRPSGHDKGDACMSEFNIISAFSAVNYIGLQFSPKSSAFSIVCHYKADKWVWGWLWTGIVTNKRNSKLLHSRSFTAFGQANSKDSLYAIMDEMVDAIKNCRNYCFGVNVMRVTRTYSGLLFLYSCQFFVLSWQHVIPDTHTIRNPIFRSENWIVATYLTVRRTRHLHAC